MKQIFFYRGRPLVDSVPEPVIRNGFVQIKVRYSAISSGTEIETLRASGESLMAKLRERPKLLATAAKVLASSGIAEFFRLIREKKFFLGVSGYAVSGTVMKSGVPEYAAGDEVVAWGAEYAFHAELVVVPAMLVQPISEGLPLSLACVAPTGAIALHAVRRGQFQFGEFVAVVGLGVLGIQCCLVLKAAGIKVVGFDVKEAVVSEVQNSWGIEARCSLDNQITNEFSDSFDGAIAATSKCSKDVLDSIAQLVRQKGNLVILGGGDLEISRDSFYKKELEIIPSQSLGPGRYDPSYEIEGIDYPRSFVRWTQSRNVGCYLEFLAENSQSMLALLNVIELNLAETSSAFSPPAPGKINIISFEVSSPSQELIECKIEGQDVERSLNKSKAHQNGTNSVAIIGVGSSHFQSKFLSQLLSSNAFEIISVQSPRPQTISNLRRDLRTAVHESCSAEVALGLPQLDAAFIFSPHDSHADYVAFAFEKGLKVFVEKPVAITISELQKIRDLISQSPPNSFFCGLNREYSLFYRLARKLVDKSHSYPWTCTYSIFGEAYSTTKNRCVSARNSKLIGEGVHFIHFGIKLFGTAVSSVILNASNEDDCFVVIVEFQAGHTLIVNYMPADYPKKIKEQISLRSRNCLIECEDFRSATVWADTYRPVKYRYADDKGRKNLLNFVDKVFCAEQDYDIESMFVAHEIAIEAFNNLRKGAGVNA